MYNRPGAYVYSLVIPFIVLALLSPDASLITAEIWGDMAGSPLSSPPLQHYDTSMLKPTVSAVAKIVCFTPLQRLCLPGYQAVAD